ncbi:up-regulator of cell proliferation-like [Hyperolius riggenbachi]|uniref:up-regulator of cell proliferation-like n=1 Tax=Hyperolius riggenbachi TaxID=752182 RepID=UPI0035A33C20
MEETTEYFKNILAWLKMENCGLSELTLRDILNIGLESLNIHKLQKNEDAPWCTLSKIMSLDSTARNTQLEPDTSVSESSEDPFDMYNDTQNPNYINPLDVLCALLHCSDSFLQQEIVTKMSMCQFAVPLLLPAVDVSKCTFMLWAMRDIVKKWRPQSLAHSKGFREENVINISMPLISFVRLGKNKLSKSKILNQILNPPQQHHNFFIHDNVDGGNTKRKISKGLVEICWYFPSGKSGVFPEPFAVTNLRGDLESNWDQFTFLTQISTAVFIFLETINNSEFQLLSNCSQSDTVFYFVVSPGLGKDITKETQNILLNLLPILRIDKTNCIVKRKIDNDADIMIKIQIKCKHILENCHKSVSLRAIPRDFSGHPFVIDEDTEECQRAREHADKITREIQDVAVYKSKTMILQRNLWKDLSKIEKELCRMRKQGDKNAETHRSNLLTQRNTLYTQQYQHQMPKAMKLFTTALSDLSEKERQYFLKWMKFNLDAVARKNLSKLQAIYKERCEDLTNNAQDLQDLDKKISDSSLGTEHFLRELGQFYEAECSMIKQEHIQEHERSFTKLPEIAANLLLDGFPLELIDGDASNIPLQWITDVFTELDKKTGRQCRMRVISVLGVQSTGKSTLLNTMFGLQFPVASGRCTRGAFMTLLKVKENFQEQLGCHFILVIDTEGLKAPELASLEDSYQHDNELATLVVGLSDITIVNMAMENTTQMKDTLQIVVHAFLRMNEVGKKPKCQFVHQNVSDLSAHDKNMRERKKFLEQLDEMTKLAAKMEKRSGITKFTDIMKYDLNKDSWYIPGLWQGDPPMAPVNLGYSSNLLELKRHLFKFMEDQKCIDHASTISDFIIWIESLWKSVKHEKFIFCFRNSLVAKAYNKLSTQYSSWEWDFCKTIHNWVISIENSIRNNSGEICDGNSDELENILLEEENKMSVSLEKYFENSENAKLIERYKEEFKLCIKSLKSELERKARDRCHKAVSIQKGKIKLYNIQRTYQTAIENKITNALEKYREAKQEPSEMEIKKEFESEWQKTLTELQFDQLERCNVDQSVLALIKKDMSNKGPHINEALINIRSLHQYTEHCFIIDEKHIDLTWTSFAKYQMFVKQELKDKIGNLASSIIRMCDEYVQEEITSINGYDEMHSKQLLHVINTELSSKYVKKLHFTLQFELDIKLHIFGNAAQVFEKLQEKFIQDNDPRLCLEKLKPQYWSTFLNIFHKKDEGPSRAIHFCDRCLKPAVEDYVFKHLGQKILDDILNSNNNAIFSSKSCFQSHILTELLEEMSFQKCVDYINSYEAFTEQWLLSYLRKKYFNSPALEALQKEILLSIDKKLRTALKSESCRQCNTVPIFLQQFCENLKSELVIPQNEMNFIALHSSEKVEQFSQEVEKHLEGTEQQIQIEFGSMDIDSMFSRLTVKPQDELSRRLIGCGKQCPFCKVPCEAGGTNHANHIASVHRPQGMGNYKWEDSEKLIADICSTLVISSCTFKNVDTGWEWNPYKDYQTYYPDWTIQPDSSIECSDYWKFMFVNLNQQFANEYKTEPADLPELWKQITKQQALLSLKKSFSLI